jgi:Mlc titration factor MtfA (ptsG expression regulator)
MFWRQLFSRWRRPPPSIPEALWGDMLGRYHFIAQRPADDLAQLRGLCAQFLASKEFHGAHGLQVTDEMALAIAAQACLPVLKLGLRHYQGFEGIVVQADEVVARRVVTDEDGVVHEYDEWLTGEAMEGGPVMLSWPDVAMAGETTHGAYNVVIHEFAHVLDMGNGEPDGMPALPDEAARLRWAQTLDTEYEAFLDDLDAGLDTLLDPYGGEAPEEFFAVAAEAFFVQPQAMRAEHPSLYALLAGYFQQDPAKVVA